MHCEVRIPPYHSILYQPYQTILHQDQDDINSYKIIIKICVLHMFGEIDLRVEQVSVGSQRKDMAK